MDTYAVDTVAVTKQAEGTVAASVAQSMNQAKAEAAATVAELAAKAEPAAAVKQIQAAAPLPASKAVQPMVPAVTPKPAAKPVAAVKAAPVLAMALAGDAVKGKSLARKCAACHNFNDKKKVGPGLKAVVGRKAGSMTDMSYSASLASASWSWNATNLAAWLCDSKQAVKTLSGDASASTKMPAQRICDPAQQTDLFAFLKTL